MYTSILVPLDGSPLAEQALPAAVTLARRHDATLTLMRVQPERQASQSYFGAEMLGELRAMYEQHQSEAREYLFEIAAQLRERENMNVECALGDGSIGSAICRYAAQAGIDLIVMTTHGRTGLSRAWLGSVADAVVRHSHRPTLLLRPAEDARSDTNGADGTFRNVVVPLDGSADARAVLPHAAALGDSAKTRYTLVHIVSPIAAPPAPLTYQASGPSLEATAIEQRIGTARDDLSAAADELRRAVDGAEIDVEVTVDHRPAHEILELVERRGADLVAMMTHGRGASRHLLGSVADKILRGANSAVLLYRPAQD